MMQVRSVAADAVQVEIRNATPIEAMGLTLIPPDALRTAYFMRRIDAHTWGLYALSATSDAASPFVNVGATSYVNRALALFAHFAGPGASPPAPAPR
jgi:hypothetical protein